MRASNCLKQNFEAVSGSSKQLQAADVFFVSTNNQLQQIQAAASSSFRHSRSRKFELQQLEAAAEAASNRVRRHAWAGTPRAGKLPLWWVGGWVVGGGGLHP
jgi:hypothetical protein